MYRWLAVLRFVLLANAIALNIYRGGFSHPVGAGFVLAGMTVWTFVISWAYHAYSRRTTVWVVSDLAVALVVARPDRGRQGARLPLDGPGLLGDGRDVRVGHPLAGDRAAWSRPSCSRSPTSLTRHYLSETVYGNLFLLLIGGPIVGLMVDSLLRSATRTAAAERAAAAAAERTRLARAVHDGVLQVLALVQRRGPDLGPDGVELGRLAGEQEHALRALIRQQDAVGPTPGVVDLVGELSSLERRPRRLGRGTLGRRTPGEAGGRRDRGRRVGLPRQRRGPRRTLGPGLGAARGHAGRAGGHRPRRGAGHPAGTAGGGRAARAGWGSPRRCGAGWPSSGVRPRCPPAPTAPSGS